MKTEYNELLKHLSTMTLEEVILMFMEAKTGHQDKCIENMPVELLNSINAIEMHIKEFYSNEILNQINN